MAWTKRAHLVKIGGEFRHTGIDMVQTIAPNAFFVFAGTFPTNNAIANLLLGAPVTFYQGLGDFDPRASGSGAPARTCRTSGASRRALTLNYGLRYERINPFTEIEDRLNGFIPGVQSQRQAGRAGGPGVSWRPGHRRAALRTASMRSCRAPASRGIRPAPACGRCAAAYGLFYDQFQNGAGTTSQVAISATPWAQFVQFSGAGLNFQNPYSGRTPPAAETFVRPSTVFALDPDAKPPSVQNWNAERAALVPRAGTSSKFATSAPRARICRATSRRTPRSSGPARRHRTPTAAGSTPTVRPTAAPATCPPSRCCKSVARSSYQAGQASVSRRFGDALGVQRVVLVLADRSTISRR